MRKQPLTNALHVIHTASADVTTKMSTSDSKAKRITGLKFKSQLQSLMLLTAAARMRGDKWNLLSPACMVTLN